MLKCPLCGFENEDGALFCEQCKSDLSSVPESPAPANPPEMPMGAVVDEPTPILSAEPVVETLPQATLEPAALGDTLPLAELLPFATDTMSAQAPEAPPTPVMAAAPAA